MKQLGTLDSAFINLEQAGTPQHIGGFGIYDQSTAPGGSVRFKDVIANYELRLKNMPIFRTRLVEVPLGLDKPYWVIDENFDVEFHLRHISLPNPGDWRQLCILIARLHARPLDMKRPLWECYIIEGLDQIKGLPKGAFAVYTKIHHSMVDGSGSDNFMAALHDLEPNPKKRRNSKASAEKQQFELPLSTTTMLRNAATNSLKSVYRGPVGLFKTTSSVIKTITAIARHQLPSMPSGIPKTRFDLPVGPHRVFEGCLFDLADFKTISKATGTTINDTATCVVAGGMRKYLQHHNELPEESMAGMMPVDVSAGSDSKENNRIGAVICLLHTNIEDHLERLKAIQASTTDAKKFVGTPLSEMTRLPGVFNPWLSKGLARIYVEKQLTTHLPMANCGAITNVRGPNVPLYTAGAKLVQYYCTGLLTAGVGSFHAIFSMNDTLSFSVLADRDIMPDPEFYKQCLVQSFNELKQQVINELPTTGGNLLPISAGKKSRKTVTTRARKSKPSTRQTD